MIDTKVYCVFPAAGKTWLYLHQDKYGLKMLDSDSSQFHWELGAEGKGLVRIKNPEWPDNYIRYIKNNIGIANMILVSTHKEVRNALNAAGIDYIIVLPEKDAKAEYIGRCYIREQERQEGCSVDAMYNNWEKWWVDCINDGHKCLILNRNEHFSDYFKDMMM